MLSNVVSIGLGGACGSLARYALSGVVQRVTGPEFPWGTAVVNITGCFIFGALWGLSMERMILGGEMRAALFIGFLGGLTTFSSLIFETGHFVRGMEMMMAVGNITLNVMVGLLAYFSGLVIGSAV